MKSLNQLAMKWIQMALAALSFSSLAQSDVALGQATAVKQAAADKYALLIGVTDYEKPELNTGLKYPEADALAVGKSLEGIGFTVDFLLGSNATCDAIRSKLNDFSNHGNNQGVVFVGLFGHGTEFEGSNKSYFCCYDTRMKAFRDKEKKALFGRDGKPMMELVADSMIAIEDVLIALGESKAANRVLIADCCRDDPNRARGRSFGSSLTIDRLPIQTLMLLSCSSQQKSFEHDDWLHGALTKCLLDQLDVAKKSGKKTMGSIAEDVIPAVEKLIDDTIKKGERQTPRMLSTGRVELLMPYKGKDEMLRKMDSEAENRRIAGIFFEFARVLDRNGEKQAKSFAQRYQSDSKSLTPDKLWSSALYALLYSGTQDRHPFDKDLNDELAQLAIEAQRIDADNTYTHYIVGERFRRQNLNEAAKLEFQIVANRNPQLLEAQLAMLWLMETNKSHEPGIDLARSLTKSFPKDYRAYNALGTRLFNAKKYDEGLVQIELAIELDPENPLLWNNKGYGLFHGGKTSQSLDAYEKAAKLAWRSNPWILKNASKAFLKDNSLKAMEFAKQAASIDPQSPDGWVAIFNVHMENGRKAEAMSALDDGLEANFDIGLLLPRASLHLENGNFDRALSDIQMMEAAKAGIESFGWLKVRAYIGKGMKNKAEDVLNQMLKYCKDNNLEESVSKELQDKFDEITR